MLTLMLTDLSPALWVIGPACIFLLILWLRQSRTAAPLGSDSLVNAAACGLAFLGLLWFLRFGYVPWNEQDWKDTDTFYRSIREAMAHRQLPYYLLEEIPPTTLYFANPQAPLGPDLLLLPLLSVPAVYLIHSALVFAAGCLGLLALRRTLDLTPLTFAVLLAVFTFNGHLLSHLNVGHGMWINLLLLPWVFVALIREGQQEDFRANGVALVLTLAALVLVGAWHTFVGAATFVGVFCLQSRRLLWFGARALALLVPIIAFRLLPAVVALGGGQNEFLSGFPSVSLMYEAVAVGWASPVLNDQLMGWWEYDTHITLAGLIILCIGLWPFRRDRFRALDLLYLPSLTLVLLAYGNVYRDTLFHLPGFVSQRVTTRLLIIPVLALFVRGAVRLDTWLVRGMQRRAIQRLAALGVALLVVVPLLFEASRIRVPPGSLPSSAPVADYSTDVDEAYARTVKTGIGISVLGLLALAYVARGKRETGSRQASPS